MNLKNNITVLGTIIITMLGILQCYAQQTPTFSEYNYNPFILNSAYAGLTANTELSVSNAGYFNDFEGSPRSFSLSGHGQLNRGKVGLGAGIIRDQIGVTTSTSFFGAYSYKIFFDFEANTSENIHTPYLCWVYNDDIQQELLGRGEINQY